MDSKLRIGFIGYGNMAQAIATGLVTVGCYNSQQLFACAQHFDKLQQTTAALGIQAVDSATAVVQQCDYIILAVKPHLIETVIAPIHDLLANKVVISVAAGYNFAKYSNILPSHTQHISTIPNTPIAVGAGILICEQQHSLSPATLDNFTQLFSQIALIEMVDTNQLSIAGTLSGCSPAFTAMYLEALADAAVKHGLSRDASYRIAAAMLSGTGKLALEHKLHPGILKDAVCSPGGSTIRGVAALEQGGFRGLVIAAIDAIEHPNSSNI